MVAMDRLEELRRRHAAAEQGGGPERQARQHKEGKLSARERIELLLDENTFEELDKLVTHRCRDFGMEDQVVARRRLRHRLWPHRRPARLRLRAGLHGVRRVAFGEQRAEDLQDHGPRAEDRRAGDRAERFRRRADSGRRRLARGLRRYLPAQHAGERRRAADLGDYGAVRRRRGLLARHHGFRLHGGPHQLHVRDRSRRDQDGDPRGRHEGKARRLDDAQLRQRGRPLHRGR